MVVRGTDFRRTSPKPRPSRFWASGVRTTVARSASFTGAETLEAAGDFDDDASGAAAARRLAGATPRTPRHPSAIAPEPRAPANRAAGPCSHIPLRRVMIDF